MKALEQHVLSKLEPHLPALGAAAFAAGCALALAVAVVLVPPVISPGTAAYGSEPVASVR